MQRWEIKRHWVPVDLESSQPPTGRDNVKTVDIVPTWKDGFKKAWAEAELLADDGWELISVVPETRARCTGAMEESNYVTAAFSFTGGYMLVFRKPKQ